MKEKAKKNVKDMKIKGLTFRMEQKARINCMCHLMLKYV